MGIDQFRYGEGAWPIDSELIYDPYRHKSSYNYHLLKYELS